MRVLMICGGSGVVFGDGRNTPIRMRGLTGALRRAGHEIATLTAGADALRRDGSDPGALTLRRPDSVSEIAGHLERMRPDLVIEHFLPGVSACARATVATGVPHVFDFTSDPPIDARGWPGVLALSRGGIAISEPLAARLRARMPGEWPVVALPNAADPGFLTPPPREHRERVRRELNLGVAEFRVGYFGALTADTGVLALVAAVGRLAAEVPTRLVVIGDGPARNDVLRDAWRERAPLAYPGRVAHDRVSAYLAHCHVAVVPAIRDAGKQASLSMLEALAMGQPVIVPTAPGASITEVPCRQVQAGDPGALYEALRNLAEDPEERRVLGISGRRVVEARHTWDARVGGLLAFAAPLIAA